MARAVTVKGRVSKGRIVPMEEVDLPEGAEVTITFDTELTDEEADAILERTAGAWEGTLDFDAYLEDLRANRRAPTREVKL